MIPPPGYRQWRETDKATRVAVHFCSTSRKVLTLVTILVLLATRHLFCRSPLPKINHTSTPSISSILKTRNLNTTRTYPVPYSHSYSHPYHRNPDTGQDFQHSGPPCHGPNGLIDISKFFLEAAHHFMESRAADHSCRHHTSCTEPERFNH